jgi:hypothetical protein
LWLSTHPGFNTPERDGEAPLATHVDGGNDYPAAGNLAYLYVTLVDH